MCQSSDLVSKGNNKAWRVPTFIILHARKTKSFCRVQWRNKTKRERKISKAIQISQKAARDATSDWTNWSFPCSCYVKASLAFASFIERFIKTSWTLINRLREWKRKTVPGAFTSNKVEFRWSRIFLGGVVSTRKEKNLNAFFQILKMLHALHDKIERRTYTNKTWHLNLLSVTSQIPQQLKLDEDNTGKLN